MRRLLAHINHLPRDSAYVRTLSGDAAYWDEGVELQARTLDAIERLSYYLLKVNGNDPDEPEPMHRPGVTQETVTLADFNSMILG